MKSNVFIFHGTEGYPEENWFPWLKQQLEQYGYSVIVPQFPSSPIKAAVFVGAPIGVQPILNYDRDNSFSGFDFNWDVIKGNAGQFIVYHSDDDPYVGLDNGKELARHLGVELSFIPNAGHFNTRAGYTEFDDLLSKVTAILKDS